MSGDSHLRMTQLRWFGRSSHPRRVSVALTVITLAFLLVATVQIEPAPPLRQTPLNSQSRASQASHQALEKDARAVTNDRRALRQHIALLEEGLLRLRTHADYTSTFFKQEKIDGNLQDGETIRLKLRHRPFSVHMEWNDTGRESLYVDGKHDGRVLVRLGGWKRRLGTVRLDPSGKLAMGESRYAITEIGLLLLSERLIAERKADRELKQGISCRMLTTTTPRGHERVRFVVEYDNPARGSGYRKLITDIDKQSLLPVEVKYYEWPAQTADEADPISEAETLIAHYAYSDLRFDCELNDDDFTIRESSSFANIEPDGVGE